jgi:hypothetical protein
MLMSNHIFKLLQRETMKESLNLVLNVEKNERSYQMMMPYGCPSAEVAEVINEFIAKIKEYEEAAIKQKQEQEAQKQKAEEPKVEGA